MPSSKRWGWTPCKASLDDAASLRRLVEGTRAVVHCSGSHSGTPAQRFHRVNVAGTARLVSVTAESQARPRVLLMSSLAAREPAVSPYAASKRGGEEALFREAQGLEHLCLRLPAVYGPGDRATLALFRQLNRGLAVLPAPLDNRFSLLYIQDLVGLVERLLQRRFGRARLSRWTTAVPVAMPGVSFRRLRRSSSAVACAPSPCRPRCSGGLRRPAKR